MNSEFSEGGPLKTPIKSLSWEGTTNLVNSTLSRVETQPLLILFDAQHFVYQFVIDDAKMMIIYFYEEWLLYYYYIRIDLFIYQFDDEGVYMYSILNKYIAGLRYDA